MRSMMKTIVFGSILAAVVMRWETLTGIFDIQNAFQDDVDLLIRLGSMIGYTLFIGFAFFVQQAQIRDVVHSNKSKGRLLYTIFSVLTILFLSYMLLDFSIQIALVNLMLYLIIVSIFDFIGERIVLVTKANKSHAKTII